MMEIGSKLPNIPYRFSDMLEDDLINWNKCKMMAREIKKLGECSKKSYSELIYNTSFLIFFSRLAME